MNQSQFEVEVDRVAGELKITIYIDDEEVRVEFSGLNSERLFEHLPRGRDYRIVPYIMSRICGVCSHAHFWASNLAIESALGIEVDEATAEIRDVCNKLQIIENHLVHLFVMAFPDYAILDHEKVRAFLKARTTALEALGTLCGRLTNPQTYQPGGFTKNITTFHVERAIALVENLEKLLENLLEFFITSVKLPRVEDPSPNYVALSTWPEKSVPIAEPYTLVGSLGPLRINSENYLEYFNETRPSYSRSKRCTLAGRALFVGARARLLAREYVVVDQAVFETIAANPYGNLLAKAVEARYLVADIAQRLRNVAGKAPRRSRSSKLGGRGLSVIEAPRGLLLHYYEIGDDGKVARANIITPTVLFTKHVEKSTEALVRKLQREGVRVDLMPRYVEALVRSYDPCIPCAVHVVKGIKGGRV